MDKVFTYLDWKWKDWVGEFEGFGLSRAALVGVLKLFLV